MKVWSFFLAVCGLRMWSAVVYGGCSFNTLTKGLFVQYFVHFITAYFLSSAVLRNSRPVYTYTDKRLLFLYFTGYCCQQCDFR